MARTIRLTVPINQGEEDFLRAVEGLVNKTRNIDITIDFSMWDEFSMSLAEETDMGALIEKPASELNNQMIPIYRRQPRERGFSCYNYFIIKVKDKDALRYSSGGTSVRRIMVNGKFTVKVGYHSGATREFFFREV